MMRSMVAVVLAGCATGEAADLTPQQISAALGSPAGVDWSVDGPVGGAWTGGGNKVNLSGGAAGQIFTLGATVDGPGVLALDVTGSNTAYEMKIFLNGVQSGGTLQSYAHTDRVQIPAGRHVVRWSAQRRSYYTAAQGFANARWMPFATVALGDAAGSPGVVLSGPWIGQDQWHAGDGAAAWSGIQMADPVTFRVPEVPVLRAGFDGPGIFSFRAKGGEYFRLDGGSWTWNRDSAAKWSSKRIVVGEGAHTMEWRPSDSLAVAGRETSEALVDEVRISPEVDLATALGTPGWSWSAPESGGLRAYGMNAPDAEGGSLAVIPVGCHAGVMVSQERFMKVRFRSSNARVQVDDVNAGVRSILTAPGDEGTDWKTGIYVMPKPGLLKIGNYGGEIEIDTVAIIEPPVTLAAEIGLPEGVLSLGGTAVWALAPLPESDEYGAKVRLTEVAPDGWMEFPVTGPAEVRVDYHSVSSSSTLRVSSGGKVRWDSAEDDSYGNHVLELPAGEHVVRLDAGFSRNATGSNRTAEVTIGGISVTPLESPKILSAMDDAAEPWASSGNWKINHGPVRDGVDSLSAEGTGHGSRHKLRRTVTGPGVVSFWSFMGPVPTGYVSLSWYPEFQNRGGRSSSGGEHGWVKTSMWVPPGDHAIRWEVDGGAGQFSNMALDALVFVPSADLTLSTASGLSQAEWNMDTASPWRGVLRDGDGPLVVSPFVTMGAIAPLSTTVNGPGVLSFKWAQKGMQRPRGEFRIDGKKWREFWASDTTEEIQVIIPRQGPVELAWGGEGFSTWMSWFELSQVAWTAFPEIPLVDALDGAGMEWATSSGKPFKGRPDPGAVNGSAAQVGLLPGEEAWLEATVEGVGLFDFWLRDVPGTPTGQSRQLEWDLYVDGVKAGKYSNPTSWPPTWVLGGGTHHLRLHFRNTAATGDELFVAVDQVSWTPMAGATMPDGWSSDATGPASYFPDGGRDGGARFVIPTGIATPRWIERTFTGPGVLTWDSMAEHSYSPGSVLQVVIDGVCVMPVSDWHSWAKQRLYLPAGEHTVRWSAGPSEYRAENALDSFDAVWQVSGVSFVPGVADLMKGIDNDSLIWLAVGDDEGILQAREDAVDGDVWVPDYYGSRMYLCNAETHGLRVQARMDARRETSEPSNWEPNFFWVPPGGVVDFEYSPGYGFGSNGGPWWLDGVTVERVELTSVEEGLDLPAGHLSAVAGWQGIRSATESHDGVDSAWARADHYYEPHTITLELPAASRVKFRWKKTGSGAMGVRLDGAWLPLQEPTGEWSEAEFETGGAATVQWALVAGTGSGYANPGEGWLDGVEISAAPGKTLADVLAAGAGLQFSQTAGVADDRLWKPVSFPSADGTWRTGARVVSDAAELETTVTGPVNLSFSVWCGEQRIPVPAPPAPGSSAQVAAGSLAVGGLGVIVVNPGPVVTGRFFMVQMDGAWVQRIDRDAGGGWTEHLLHVPAGEHRVSWRLGRTTGLGYGTSIPEWQAVLGPITRTSMRQHYDGWAALALADDEAPEPDDDADGDGVSNFHEYAFGTDPRDPASVPAGITGGMVAHRIVWGQFGSAPDFELRVPRLRPHVHGILEESADLVNWTPSTMRLRNQPLLSNGGIIFSGDDSDDGVYQVMRFRGPSSFGATATRFYRVVIPMPE
jgi:hypothetical protein